MTDDVDNSVKRIVIPAAIIVFGLFAGVPAWLTFPTAGTVFVYFRMAKEGEGDYE